MSLERGIDGSEPVRRDGVGTRELRPARSTVLASGTLACPRCDAPVSPGPEPISVAAALGCPFCGEAGAVRDFLSLGEPSRPARVVVRVR